MKTLKEILSALNVSEEIINSCSDEELYSADELTSIKAEYETKLTQSELDRIVETTLVKSGARNNLAVKALLNLENAKPQKGTIEGLEEQIKKIKAENAYLFKSEQTVTAGNHNSFTSSDFDAMSDEQYYSINYRKEN